jgi:hypothetical protein
MRSRLGVLAVAALMFLAGCGGGPGSAGSVRPGTPNEDLALLQTITTALLASSGLEVEKRTTDTAEMPCTGTSTDINSGRSANVTLSLKRPDGDVTENLGEVAAALKTTNEKYFGGKGVLNDSSATPQESVMLMADGFVISVNTSTGPERWSLDSSGPCRL